MRLAFFSDIHANLAALEAVLADLATEKTDSAFCLGDAIGYGPDPEEVVQLLRARGIPCLMGNHEYALVSSSYRRTLNPVARQSLDLTAALLSPSSLAFLSSLEPFAIWRGIRAVHGCPPDSVTKYLFSPQDKQLASLFDTFPEDICLFGHTHILHVYSLEGGGATDRFVPGGESLALARQRRYLINIGSVGQPRDGTPEAKYIIFDTDRHAIEIRRLAYDVERTIRGIRQKGFPESNARRLR